MRIPQSFKEAQSRAFQDKQVWHRPKVTTTGGLGTAQSYPSTELAESYLVNLQRLSDELVAQEWGLVLARDAQMTVSDILGLPVGDYIQHGSLVYKIVGNPSADSHDRYLLQLTSEEAT